MKKLFGKLLTCVFALMFSLTSFSVVGCADNGNQFKGLIVGGLTTTYRVGDEVNFDNVVVKVEYTDAKENKTLNKSDYTVELPEGMTILSDLTTEEGSYNVKIVYLDPLFEGARREKAIVINVVPEDVEHFEGEILVPTSFTLPDTYSVYQSNVANATNERSNEESDSSFEGKFMDVEDKNYYVGTDNAFKFLPKLRVNDAFRKFTANVELSIEVENVPVTLVASEPDENIVTYSLQGTPVATVDIYNHLYKFEDALDGKTVKVSVEPSQTIYDWDEGAITAEFVIVKDAYNVHNAVEFSVLDNTEKDHHWGSKNLTDVNWNNWKTEHNINVVTDGVILHDNITITKENLPNEFFWTNSNGSTEYTDASGNKMYADTYAYDNSDFYWRDIEEGKTFKFLGNYFTVDMSALPVVASNGVQCSNEELRYGDNFSNTAALNFEGLGNAETSSLILKNVSLNGNANVSSFKDAQGYPYYAGGVIMFKYEKITSNVENTIVKTSFISYFPNGSSICNFKAVKAYDSNQSAVFTYEANEINVENSYMERAGGPLIMLRDSDPTEAGHCSTLYVKDSYLVSNVCGQELFFTSKGVQSYISMIANMNPAFTGMGSYVTMEGETPYLNAIVLILSESNDADSIVKAMGTEGKVVIDKTTDNGTKTFTATRMSCGYDDVNSLLYAAATTPFNSTELPNNVTATVKQVQKEAGEGTIAPIFACEDNYALTTYFDGAKLAYPTDKMPVTEQEKEYMKNAVKTSFQNSDYVGLYYGGMTLVMGFNH